MRGAIRLVALAVGCALLAGCSDGRRYDQAICALIDVSGTYADQRAEAVRVLKRDVLPEMVPGDTLLVIKIDSESYSKKSIVSLVTLDPRPSQADAQKLATAQALDAFVKADDPPSKHTDILGAMMLGTDYLRGLPSGSRVMLIFSDLDQDLPAGVHRHIDKGEFRGLDMVAINVKRLHGDNVDPDVYHARLAHWKKQVTAAGAAGWRTLEEPSQLPDYLASLR